MTVLVVDDDPVSRRLLELTLERSQFSVVTAASAADALDRLERTPFIDLVITDQNLGGMSGLQLFSALAADSRWSALPVILCTGAADRSTVEDAVRRGVRHFLVKPIRPPMLMEKVATVLADRPRVLEHKFETMNRLSLSEVEYRDLADTTLQRVSELQVAMRAAMDEGDLQRALDVSRLVEEPARLLGAARCLSAIGDLYRAADDLRARLALETVLREVAVLADALGRVLRPEMITRRRVTTLPQLADPAS